MIETQKPEPCPWCRTRPLIGPSRDDVAAGRQGDGFATIACVGSRCPVNPKLEVFPNLGGSGVEHRDKCKAFAVRRWNTWRKK